MRQGFIEYCKNHGVNGAFQQYDAGVSAIEAEFKVSVDLEFAKDKCSSLIQNVHSIKETDIVAGNRTNWISYLNKFVEYKSSLSIHYWVFSPGQNAKNWESDYTSKRMSIGFNNAGDLSDYNNIDEIRSRVFGNNKSSHGPDIIMSFKKVNPGDCVFVRSGLKWVIGFGVVTSEYKHSNVETEYPNYYEVEWFNNSKYSFDFTNFKGQFPPTIFQIDDEEKIISIANAISNNVGKDKHDDRSEQNKSVSSVKNGQQPPNYKNTYSDMLLKSKNIVFHGAPGTGKSYLAKKIAVDIITNGDFDDYTKLSDEQKQQVAFVQFHPSYDYSDFVEGLRPKINNDGSMGFELKDGIFKEFVDRARKDCEEKKYIFIIDEINRGEISKIFGELFFAIDPGYRGEAGEIFTQYANLHLDPNEKFYIPGNVYIIGTMNDIDRSVDSFDFAMRRRFRFVELKANECLGMLDGIDDEERKLETIRRMIALNQEIAKNPDLNENYQIGASYFLKSKDLGFDELWEDYLQPLLQEYIRGVYDEKDAMNSFAKAYGYKKPSEGDGNETAQDQG